MYVSLYINYMQRPLDQVHIDYLPFLESDKHTLAKRQARENQKRHASYPVSTSLRNTTIIP